MPEESLQEKTEDATPRKREEARSRGQVAKSPELNSFAVLFFSMIFLFYTAPMVTTGLAELMQDMFSGLGGAPGTDADATVLIREIGGRIFKILSPMFLLVVVIGISANAAQVGFRLSPKALEPKFDKLNFLAGFKRLMSRRSAVGLVRDVLKLVLIGTVAFFAVRAEMDEFVALSEMDTTAIMTFTGGTVFRVAMKIILALLALAIFDFMFQRWDFDKSIRMTKQEVKDESKQYDGSPLLKSRIRRVQRELSRARMGQEIPTADVVITNPIHLAVALRYDTDAMSAPTVVGKGARLLADKIRGIARHSGVPIVENAPLARALYSSVEVGTQIPAELYKACAEVLAHIYRLREGHHASEFEAQEAMTA